MSPPAKEDLSPSTSPTTTPKSIDKYDEIYAKYSSAIDMGLTKNNELYDHKTTVRTEKIDPPEEINNDDNISYVQSGRERRYSANTIMRGTNEFISRDDDTIHSSPSTQFSLRSNNSHSRMIGSPSQQRNVINSKLEALNAKSLALRNINYTGVYSSTSSAYSPTSVMDLQFEGDSVDSRLEYLTQQSLAYRNGTSKGSNNSNKKVTFEADYIYGSQGMRMLDDHTSSNGYDDQVVVPSSSATVASTTSLTKSANNNHTGKSSSSLAMKILSEKIMNGYTMSRNHCPACNMALLSNNEKKKKKKSFTFNEDGTLNMDSLRTTTNNNEEECVYCPMYKLRSNITKNLCKRIMASKLLSNSGVCTSGSICDNCSSPNLINSQGIVLSCEVCPLLDRICVEIVREQSNGGLKENTICMECGCSGVTSSETNKCVVCNVLNKELGVSVPYSSTTAGDRSVSSSSLLGASLVPSSSISAAGQSVYMSPQSSTLSTSGGAPLIPSLGGPQDVDQDIAESTSFTSGSTSPGSIDIAKIQEQLNKTIERMNKSGSAPDDIVSLQGQLKDELARAKLSQSALERTLQVPNTSKLSRDELRAELESTKQAQAALEKILVDANKIEKTLSTNQSLKDELLVESYSISQEEVDANGNLKEHVPEPSIFRYDNIPAVVLVYHITEQDDCDPSVAAQSHHTKNLKRSERDPVVSNSIFDCCGDAAQPQQQQNFHDYDTIGTDDDEYTLNTVGDDYSRFEMHTSRSGVSQSMHEGGNNYEKRDSSEKCTPKSNTGRCLFSCFDCGGIDDDAYTMVSKRGIILQPQHQQSPRYEQQSPQYREGGRGDISVGSASIRKSYFREDSDAYSPVGSEYDESIPASPKMNGRPPLPPSLKYPRFGGGRYASPTSPTSVISDWSSINEDSAFDSPARPKSSLRPPRYPESPPRSPQFSRFSGTHSVTSELTDFSNRRVKFGQGNRPNQRAERKQLSVLSEESLGGGSFAAVFKETKDTRCGIGMSNTKNGMLVISRIEEDGLFADTNLQVGMKVNYINGECVRGWTGDEAAQLIREKEGQVTINSEDIPRNDGESVAIDSVFSTDTDVLLSRLESVTSGQRQGLYSSDRL